MGNCLKFVDIINGRPLKPCRHPSLAIAHALLCVKLRFSVRACQEPGAPLSRNLGRALEQVLIYPSIHT